MRWDWPDLIWEIASWKIWPIATAVRRVLTRVFCIYSYCSVLGCYRPRFHIALKTGRVVTLLHILNISRPLLDITVWPWKFKSGHRLFLLSFPPNQGCEYEGAVCMRNPAHSAQFARWRCCLGSCCSARGPFKWVGLNTHAVHSLVWIPLENTGNISNLLKTRLKLFFCQMNNCLVYELKTMFRAVIYYFKYKAIMPSKLGDVRMCVFLSIWAWPLCVCFNLMGCIRSSGRNHQGRVLRLVSLFYSIALLIHNLKYQDCGEGRSAAVWWVKSKSRGLWVSWAWDKQGWYLGGEMKAQGENVPCTDASLKGKCKPVCRSGVRLYIV